MKSFRPTEETLSIILPLPLFKNVNQINRRHSSLIKALRINVKNEIRIFCDFTILIVNTVIAFISLSPGSQDVFLKAINPKSLPFMPPRLVGHRVPPSRLKLTKLRTILFAHLKSSLTINLRHFLNQNIFSTIPSQS